MQKLLSVFFFTFLFYNLYMRMIRKHERVDIHQVTWCLLYPSHIIFIVTDQGIIRESEMC